MAFRWRSWTGVASALFILYGAVNLAAAIIVPTLLISGGAGGIGSGGVVFSGDADSYLLGSPLGNLRSSNPKLDTLLEEVRTGPSGPRIAAFFDFDGTLIDGYSAAALYSHRLRGSGSSTCCAPSWRPRTVPSPAGWRAGHCGVRASSPRCKRLLPGTASTWPPATATPTATRTCRCSPASATRTR